MRGEDHGTKSSGKYVGRENVMCEGCKKGGTGDIIVPGHAMALEATANATYYSILSQNRDLNYRLLTLLYRVVYTVAAPGVGGGGCSQVGTSTLPKCLPRKLFAPCPTSFSRPHFGISGGATAYILL